MLRLRPYKSCDAAKIAEWIRDEDVFLKWGGQLFGDFPISAEIIDEKYRLQNGGCTEPDNFYPWVAIDEENCVVGHFIMRYLRGDHRLLRFGWVVVDDTIRGKGYGTEMLRLGLRYAFGILGVDKVTLGVFEGNERAHSCYRKAGFSDTGEVVEKQPWNVIEMAITRDRMTEIQGE
jgi:Acetyltransferases, including N-acetylases of ribosomal proteins